MQNYTTNNALYFFLDAERVCVGECVWLRVRVGEAVPVCDLLGDRVGVSVFVGDRVAVCVRVAVRVAVTAAEPEFEGEISGIVDALRVTLAGGVPDADTVGATESEGALVPTGDPVAVVETLPEGDTERDGVDVQVALTETVGVTLRVPLPLRVAVRVRDAVRVPDAVGSDEPDALALAERLALALAELEPDCEATIEGDGVPVGDPLGEGVAVPLRDGEGVPVLEMVRVFVFVREGVRVEDAVRDTGVEVADTLGVLLGVAVVEPCEDDARERVIEYART